MHIHVCRVCARSSKPRLEGSWWNTVGKDPGRPLRPQYVKLSEGEEGYCVVCNHTDTHSSLTRWKNGKAVAHRPHSRPTQTCMPHACTLSHRNLKQRQWKLYGRLKGFVHPTPLHVLPQHTQSGFLPESWFNFHLRKELGSLLKYFRLSKKLLLMRFLSLLSTF